MPRAHQPGLFASFFSKPSAYFRSPAAISLADFAESASWSHASAPDHPDWRLGRTRVSLTQSVGLLIYLWRLPGGNLRCAQIKLHKEERTKSGSEEFPREE